MLSSNKMEIDKLNYFSLVSIFNSEINNIRIFFCNILFISLVLFRFSVLKPKINSSPEYYSYYLVYYPRTNHFIQIKYYQLLMFFIFNCYHFHFGMNFLNLIVQYFYLKILISYILLILNHLFLQNLINFYLNLSYKSHFRQDLEHIEFKILPENFDLGFLVCINTFFIKIKIYNSKLKFRVYSIFNFLDNLFKGK